MSSNQAPAPTYRTVSFKELVQKALGKEYDKPLPAYEFSNGRKFEDPKPPASAR